MVEDQIETAQKTLLRASELLTEVTTILEREREARNVAAILKLSAENPPNITTEAEISDLLNLLDRIVEENKLADIKRKLGAFSQAARTTTNHKTIRRLVDAA